MVADVRILVNPPLAILQPRDTIGTRQIRLVEGDPADFGLLPVAGLCASVVKRTIRGPSGLRAAARSPIAGLRAAIPATFPGTPTITTDPQAEFDSAFSVENLSRIFDNLKEAKRDRFAGVVKIPTGWDRVSLADFERQRDTHLSALSRKAIGGRYTFRPSLYRDVPKMDGNGTRRICFPGIRDGLAQRALHQVLAPAVDRLLTPAAFAYRTGFDTHGAIDEIIRATQAGRPWIFESDLEKFFDRLNHHRLERLIAGLPIDERARTMIWRFMRTGEAPADGQEGEIKQLRTEGVPQGGVLSGTLANLYMVAFDDALQSTGFKLVRYADDLVVLGGERSECELAQARAAEEAEKIGLTLHPRKTHIRHVNDGVEFLGFRIRGTRVSVRPANLRKFKARIDAILADTEERLATNGQQAKLKDLVRLITRIRFKVEGVGEGDDRRSWLSYFRIVNDVSQLRNLDRFVTGSLKSWARRQLGIEVTRGKLRNLGHRFLVTEYWRVRRQMPTRKFHFRGFVATVLEKRIDAAATANLAEESAPSESSIHSRRSSR